MAQLDTSGGGGDGGGGKHKKKRAKKVSTHIDMTPMVDLAFLLLTFFMLTTTFSKPKTLEINMPAEPPPDQERIKVPNALTFLVSGDNKIFYYYGELKGDVKLEKTNYSKDGLRKVLLDRNKWTVDELKKAENDIKAQNIKDREMADSLYKAKRAEVFKNKKSLTVLLKADEKAKYKNVVDVLDELQITDVGKFAIVDLDSIEVVLLKSM